MTIQISESQIIELDTDGVGGYKLVSATDPSVWSCLLYTSPSPRD